MRKVTFSRLLLICTVLLFTISFSTSSYAANPGDVVINEIAWMGTESSYYDEWIELYNTTDAAIDLTGWTLYASDGSPEIDLSGTIPANGFYLMERTDDNCVTDVTADLIYSGNTEDGGENFVLRDGSSNIIDQVLCETAGDWYAGINGPDTSMERKDPCTGGDVSTNWADNDGVTKNGTDNSGNPINGTPKADNSVLDSTCAGDITPPQVSSTVPNSGATGIVLTSDIIITFNESMDQASTTAFSIAPDPGGHTFSWNGSDSQMTVMLNDFTADTWYTVTLSTAAVDLNGNELDGDSDGNTGPAYIFTFLTQDATPPDTITDLVASDGPGNSQVTVEWTAVGDDGNVGTADAYLLKYSTQPITNDTDFNNATTYSQTWTPQASGNTENFVLDMPSAGTLYYFSVKAIDDSTNYSPFGNVDSATSGDSSTSVSPNVKAAADGLVTYSFTYNIISPAFTGNDSFRLIVPATWGTVSNGIVEMELDGSPYTGFTISGQQITASNITAGSTIEVTVGPIDVQTAPESNVEFEMYTDIDGAGFVKVDDSPVITVAEPANISVTPATDPHNAPGAVDVVTVEITDSSSDDLFGAELNLTIISNPGGDSTVNPNPAYTDLSGTGTFNFRLSSQPGENTVRIVCNSLTAYFTDTAYAGNYISQNYPNPFNLNDHDKTTFKINLESKQQVLFKIYNINGQTIRTLFEGEMDQGLNEITWNGTNDHGKQLDAGVYLVFFKYGNETETFKMTIIK